MDRVIYCQKDIPKDKWRYGFRSSAQTGCGWIATYNALCVMGYKPNAQMVIKYFQRQVPLFNGNTGTFILSPAMFFKRFGFGVKITVNPADFDKIAKDSDVCILYYWWHQKKKVGAHFVALHNTPKGFVGYNTFNNSTGPDIYGNSLEAFVKNRKYFGMVLMGIKDRKK